MVMVENDSLFLQLRWPYRLVVILGNFIVLVALLSVCICCFKRKQASHSEKDETDYEVGDDDGKFGSNVSLLKKSLLSDDENVKSFHLLSPNDHENLNLQPSPQPMRKSVDSRSSSILGLFQKIGIQPAYEDLVPFNSSRANSIAVPEAIPDAPTGLTEELGSIYFSVSYDVFGLVLKVLIQKAVNLPAKDLFGTSDPYVKIHLHPCQKSQKLKTRIRMKNLNPIWNEVFTFEGFPHEKLLHKSLYLKVFDYDRFTRDDALGEIELALGNVSLQQEPVEFVKKLRPCKHSRGYLGDLLVSTSYNPTMSRITIIVMKGSRLKSMDVTGKSDPYVKLYLLYAGRKIENRKTEVKKGSLNPVWNEVFEFELPLDKVRATSVVFTVKDHDAVLPNKLIGKVVIGQRTAGTSLKHWTDMLNSPRKSIAMWHTIVK